ncbi:MAG: hypothetical protein H6960_08025 [Chromatiaceae bacterium]|nr:hypothetical protein [Gammaproteobacteria bacterium]MCP5438091.1 hypothetical protein [Chromatiaceae bacterium]
MGMRSYMTSALFPPVGACRYGCGTNCAAPVTVFWLFGVVSVIYGLLGGPTGEPGISWYTVGLGFGMWGIAAVWTMLTIQGVEADRCHGMWSPRDHHVAPDEAEADPFDEIKKVH